MRPFAVVLAVLAISGCHIPWPMPPELDAPGTCRDFRLVAWGGGAPFDEANWTQEIAAIDEPLLPQWGWAGDLGSNADVCGPIGVPAVAAMIANLRAANPGKVIWLNWSSDEIAALSRANCPGFTWGLGADVYSVDDYAGPWGWPNHTSWMLEMLYRGLQPGQSMGLIPEAWTGIYDESDLVLMAALYWDFAMKHPRVAFVAPFYWGPCPECMSNHPRVAAQWAAMSRVYPRCVPATR